MMQPRLLADFAAVPTARERRSARTYHRSQQCDLFAAPIEHEHQDHERTPCAVCTSPDHDAEACPRGTALALFPEPTPHQDTPTMPTSTSAQRDENRLTPADLAAMAAAVTDFARRTSAMGTGERYTTAERIAHRAIGCDERDLRDSELLAIRQLFKPILAAHHANKVTS